MENIAEQATAAAVAGAMPRFADGTIIEEVFQGAAWQRCVVHLMRDCARAGFLEVALQEGIQDRGAGLPRQGRRCR